MDLDGTVEPGGTPVQLALDLAVSHLGSPLEPGGEVGAIPIPYQHLHGGYSNRLC